MRLNAHDNTAKDYRRAVELRNGASPIEKRLWRALRESAKAAGLKFRRQQAVHPYIADFACMEARLLVELDGETHATSKQYDQMRDDRLWKQGYSIMRISNADMMRNVEGVVVTIIEQAMTLMHGDKLGFQLNSPLPNPPREGEGIPAVLMETEG